MVKLKRYEVSHLVVKFGEVVNKLEGETWLAVAKAVKDLGAIEATTNDLKKDLITRLSKKDEDGKPLTEEVKEGEQVVAHKHVFEDDAKAISEIEMLLNEEVEVQFKKVKYKNWCQFPAEYKDIQLWLLDKMIEE